MHVVLLSAQSSSDESERIHLIKSIREYRTQPACYHLFWVTRISYNYMYIRTGNSVLIVNASLLG